MDNMSNCKNCGNEITWKTPYVKGDGPLNVDGSPHKCQKSSQPRQDYVKETVETNWPTLKVLDKRPDMVQLQEGSIVFTALAVENVLARVPEINKNGNLFGQMVNAEKTHLINLALVKAIKERK